METNDKGQLLLEAFANRSTLEQIGVARVSKLMESFRSEFDSAGICLPGPENERYLETIAGLLGNSFALPMRLLNLLLRVELAAAPGNGSRLDEAITRRIVTVRINSWWCEHDGGGLRRGTSFVAPGSF